MIELTLVQTAPRIEKLLVVHESLTLDFKRVSGKMAGTALEMIHIYVNIALADCLPMAAYHIRKRKLRKNLFVSVTCCHNG